MDSGTTREAFVVGAGPNGLAAAIALARTGLRVRVYERDDAVGGGTRSAELTEPGFLHDVCSAVFPLALASPFFDTLPLARHGLAWVEPPAPLAHPFDDGSAVVLERSLDATANALGQDGAAYRKLIGPFVSDWDRLKAAVLAPLRVQTDPGILLRFGRVALRSARGLATSTFHGERARALFAGLAAHSALPLDRAVTAGYGLLLAVSGHAVGWPIARGGSQRIADALASHLRSLGGEIVTGHAIRSLEELVPASRQQASLILCDVSPRGLLELAGERLPPRYRRRLERFRYGPAAYKIDYALDGPIPWKAKECARAATVHLGGSITEIARSEALPVRGGHAEQPFVLLVQPTLFDPSRAPGGKHTAWAYCHVPNGSEVPMAERIERQIERFAPGFKDRVIARSIKPPGALERSNPNLVGGDLNGGMQGLGQLLGRPTWRRYSTPLSGLYICSASTPPGGGVHGMCGYYAALRALRRPRA
jgi:phytoene dehydrogenase-like protein